MKFLGIRKTEFRNNFGSIFWEPRNLWLAFEDDGFGQPLTISRHSAKRRKMKIPEIAGIQIFPNSREMRIFLGENGSFGEICEKTGKTRRKIGN